MADSVTTKSDEGAFQSVFVNEFTHTMDAKGRFAIPTEWRKMLRGDPPRILVLPSFNSPCLDVYPALEFQHRLQKFRDMQANDAKGRDFARSLGSRSDLAVLDTQGRVRIKESLLKFAGLTKEVMLIGAFDRFEIWTPEAWAKEISGHEEDHLIKAAEEAGGF